MHANALLMPKESPTPRWGTWHLSTSLPRIPYPNCFLPLPIKISSDISQREWTPNLAACINLRNQNPRRPAGHVKSVTGR
jgi:hypothetical protein